MRNGETVSVKVKVGASQDTLVIEKGRVLISVRAKAEGGKANERVQELLAKHFGVPMGSIRLMRGHRTPNKIFSIIA